MPDINKNQQTDIDIGLAVLCNLADDDQTLTIIEIADVCNCSRSRIHQIQQRAMNKIGKKLRLSGYEFSDIPNYD